MKIVISTGSGISQESGVPTFRERGGIWDDYNLEDVATPEGFFDNISEAMKFHHNFKKLCEQCYPNKAHRVCAEISKNYDTTIITQNIDGLHYNNGYGVIYETHGNIHEITNREKSIVLPWVGNEHLLPKNDNDINAYRPNVVWFGEHPYYMDKILKELECCDIFISVGTSGQVTPAANFVTITNAIYKIEVNPEKTEISDLFDITINEVASLGMQKVQNYIKDLDINLS